MRTLENEFDPGRNSLNAIRLVLASLVVLAHSWPVGGFGEAPAFRGFDLGDWALAGFFAISGYLVTRSRLSHGGGSYFWHRFLRIYPAWLASLLLVALVIGPVTALITATRYTWGSAASYILVNSGLVLVQPGIQGTLNSVPVPTIWNGSAWTLAYESGCYILLGLVVSLVPRRFVAAAMVGLMTICALTMFAIYFGGMPAPHVVRAGAPLAGYFFAGALLYCVRGGVRIHWIGAVIAGAVLGVVYTQSLAQVLAGLPLAYLSLYAAIRLPLASVSAGNDISYGMYIYAFPIQQLIATVSLQWHFSLTGFILLSFVGTVPLALVSWFLLEKPALRLKARGPGALRARALGE